MHTLQINVGGILVATLLAALNLQAQNALDSDYEFLLSISEPARFDLYDRSIPKDDLNIVPVAAAIQAEIDLSHPLPEVDLDVKDHTQYSVTEHLQLATAFRLRGDYVAAVPHYSRIVRLSKQPIHAYFYAQALRATGQDLLADLYDARYKEGVGGAIQEQPLSDAEAKGIPAQIGGRVTNLDFGNPIPNVEVRLVNICTEEERVTATDEDGNFVFKDHPADCAFVLRFEKRFFEVVLVETAAPERDERVDVELDASDDLSFR